MLTCESQSNHSGYVSTQFLRAYHNHVRYLLTGTVCIVQYLCEMGPKHQRTCLYDTLPDFAPFHGSHVWSVFWQCTNTPLSIARILQIVRPTPKCYEFRGFGILYLGEGVKRFAESSRRSTTEIVFFKRTEKFSISGAQKNRTTRFLAIIVTMAHRSPRLPERNNQASLCLLRLNLSSSHTA